MKTPWEFVRSSNRSHTPLVDEIAARDAEWSAALTQSREDLESARAELLRSDNSIAKMRAELAACQRTSEALGADAQKWAG